MSTDLKDRYQTVKKLISQGKGVKQAYTEAGLDHWQYYNLRKADGKAVIKRIAKPTKSKPRLLEIPVAQTQPGRLIVLMGQPNDVLDAIRSLS
jgi:hypothetical protein